MGLLSGVGDALFGGGTKRAATDQRNNSTFSPYNLALSGGSVNYTNPYISRAMAKDNRKYGTPLPQGQASATLSPELQQLRELLMGGAGSTLTGGIPGLQQLLAEFSGANQDMAALPGMGQGQGYTDALGQFGAPGLPETAQQGFLGASDQFLQQALAGSNFNFDDVMKQRLDLSRSYDAPGEMRQMQGMWDSQFGRGVMDSTGGGYQTEAMARAMGAKDIQRQQAAFGDAMGLQQQNMTQQGQNIGAAMGFGQAGSDMGMGLFDRALQGAGFNLGINDMGFNRAMTMDQISAQRVGDRFSRATEMFGAGQQGQQNQMGTALGYLSGVGGLDSYLANLIQMGSNMGSQRSAANSGAFGASTQAAMARDSNMAGLISGAMSSFGPNRSGG